MSRLTYGHARYLSNKNRNWLSQDEMFIKGFSSDILLNNPQLQNSYSYATNDPVNKLDPDGRISDEVAGLQAQQVYIDGHEGEGLKNTVEKGWEYNYSMTFLGMKGSVYTRYDEKGAPVEQSISFRGSRGKEDKLGAISDWVFNNFTQPVGLSPNSWTAMYLTGQVIEASPGLKTTVVGNSKGGTEAANAAQWNEIDATVFNPAKSYFSKENCKCKIKNFTVDGEVLSGFLGVYTGPNVINITLPYTDYSTNYGSSWNPIKLVKNKVSQLNSSIQNHLMPTTNKVLNKK